jgi:hypothetical protein
MTNLLPILGFKIAIRTANFTKRPSFSRMTRLCLKKSCSANIAAIVNRDWIVFKELVLPVWNLCTVAKNAVVLWVKHVSHCAEAL